MTERERIIEALENMKGIGSTGNFQYGSIAFETMDELTAWHKDMVIAHDSLELSMVVWRSEDWTENGGGTELLVAVTGNGPLGEENAIKICNLLCAEPYLLHHLKQPTTTEANQ